MISIASWNINSVRLRIEQVVRFAREQAPDVLCLQEIKCQAHQFPAKALAELGYVHQAVHGQKGYHGVATVSRIPFGEFSRHDWQDNGEARHVGVELHGAGKGLVLENVYIPAGGDIPDREANPKFGQKLQDTTQSRQLCKSCRRCYTPGPSLFASSGRFHFPR
jgi:exodeoxyribonuclease-3